MSKVVESLYDVYQEIRPSLMSTAYRFGVSNPKLFVDEWLYDAYIIAYRFDKGELSKKVFDSSGNLKDFSTISDTDEAFLRSFRGYLRRAFYNDILISFRRLSKFAGDESLIDIEREAATSFYAIDTCLDLEPIRLDAMIDMAKEDIYDLEKDKKSLFRDTNLVFVKSLLMYLQDLNKKVGNIVVAPDVSCTNNRKFFLDDFRGDLNDGVRVEISKFVLKEDNFLLIWRLGYLIDLEKKDALEKKIFRYLFKYRGGVPDRLRKRLLKS